MVIRTILNLPSYHFIHVMFLVVFVCFFVNFVLNSVSVCVGPGAGGESPNDVFLSFVS